MNGLNEELIKSYPLLELFRKFFTKILSLQGEKWVFFVDRVHDWIVAKKILKLNPNVVVGYEKSCFFTFKKAKENNIITILDLAQVHYQHIKDLKKKYPHFAPSLGSDKLRNRIDSIKDKEYQFSDYIITLSEYAKQTLVENGISQEKIKLVNLGFDPNIFEPKKVYPREGRFRLLFVGSIMKRKGLKLLIETFKELDLHNASLTIVGPMEDGKEVLENNQDVVDYIPFLPHNELQEKYKEADVFVFPSYLDSWAMVVLEAMACGTPVIISNNTGSKDVVKKGGGFVIPVENKKELRERILFYYNNRNEVERHGKLAVKSVAEYTWDNYYLQITNTIKEITGSNE